MRTNEKTKTVSTPTTDVNGAKLAKNVPAKGTSIKAKPDKIAAKNKKIQLFIITPPFTNNICPKRNVRLMK